MAAMDIRHFSQLFPGVKVVNTFIHVEHAQPDAIVARRSVSCPPELFKAITPSRAAVRPEATQGGVASAEHVGLVSPRRLSTEEQLQDHQLGQCRPYGFQSGSAKDTSCRLGDDCQSCQFCTHKDQVRNNNTFLKPCSGNDCVWLNNSAKTGTNYSDERSLMYSDLSKDQVRKKKKFAKHDRLQRLRLRGEREEAGCC
ncbi:unnamed protein product [Polarella glacialis]|uniref:Uncharacterized protein n=1 Tax=Polarella glacialis TaxID=89957 RepID=A0A813EY11_POLGL|nr:unnamed protein product [Polarella glacialis]